MKTEFCGLSKEMVHSFRKEKLQLICHLVNFGGMTAKINQYLKTSARKHGMAVCGDLMATGSKHTDSGTP